MLTAIASGLESGNARVRHAHTRRVRAIAAALLLLPGATGCYTYVPVWNGVPAPGRDVEVGLADQGRVALAPQVGPGANKLRGRVLQRSDSVFLLAVSAVRYIDTPAIAKWSGERIAVSKDFVGGMSERRLSRSRTWIAAGLAAIAVAGITQIAIVGGGTDPGTPRPGEGPGPVQ